MLNRIMLNLNLIDTFPFYVLLILFAWYKYNKHIAIHLCLLFLFSAFINQNAKDLLSQPRPCQIDLSLGIAQAKSFGIPSGVAQAMTLMFGFLSYITRKSWFWAFSTCSVILISFSKVYLGLHFLSDIIAGWVLGFIILYCYLHYISKIIVYAKNQNKTTSSIIVVGLGIILCLFSLNKISSVAILAASILVVWLIRSELAIFCVINRNYEERQSPPININT